MYNIQYTENLSSQSCIYVLLPQRDQRTLIQAMSEALKASINQYTFQQMHKKTVQIIQIQSQSSQQPIAIDNQGQMRSQEIFSEEFLKKPQESKGEISASKMMKNQNNIEEEPNEDICTVSFNSSIRKVTIQKSGQNKSSVPNQHNFDFISCPIRHLQTSQLIRKREQLLNRQVRDWKDVGKRPKYDEIGKHKRELRMLYN